MLVNMYEALEHPEIYGDLTSMNVSYEPDGGRVVLTKEDTGYAHDQVFEAEELSWKPFAYKGQIYLVGTCPTTELTLSGEVGYSNAYSCLKRIGTIYKNTALKAKTYLLTPSMYQAMPQNLKKCCYHWLASKYKTSNGKANEEYGVKRTFGAAEANAALVSSNGKDRSCETAVRPVIGLPRNAMVEIKEGLRGQERELKVVLPN